MSAEARGFAGQGAQACCDSTVTHPDSLSTQSMPADARPQPRNEETGRPSEGTGVMPATERSMGPRATTKALRRLAAGLLLPLLAPFGVGAESVAVLRDGDIGAWEEKVFSGETRYERVSIDGRIVLRATSRGTASGLFRKQRIDLEKTPVLQWTWRVEGTLGDIDERTREGDDYSARVYVIRSDPVFFWRTRAINYVWASTRAEGESWPNAYTDGARHIAVRTGDEHAGRWLDERRDVRADFRTLFGEDVRYVDAVAIMSDTDNTGAAAVAYYGDITFRSASGQ